MSIMGELNYFLGLQVKQRDDGIFINQAKYIRELTKKFSLENAKISKTPMATTLSLIRMNKIKTLTLNSIII